MAALGSASQALAHAVASLAAALSSPSGGPLLTGAPPPRPRHPARVCYHCRSPGHFRGACPALLASLPPTPGQRERFKVAKAAAETVARRRERLEEEQAACVAAATAAGLAAAAAADEERARVAAAAAADEERARVAAAAAGAEDCCVMRENLTLRARCLRSYTPCDAPSFGASFMAWRARWMAISAHWCNTCQDPFYRTYYDSLSFS